ncbi:Store-operated calcium entry-associated regulatory factor [Escovopsis weberi]|uniref:Store-operated calcium entry-associated regulatory factor n=1 Tax=Escovopsis weberi TaxID=150374 RepID=A0A0M9VRZ3_ESCWE|nr:Store-operated calcium entry-associated regulatory factor [Escovopsis weberi]
MSPPTPLHSLLLLLLLVAASAAASPSSSSASPSSSSSPPRPQKILLSDVQLLTLRGNNALTAHRRVPSIPQLRCVSAPPLCALHAIDIMRCTNQGSSYGAEDIEWSCAADLPPELALAATDVVCEGFRDPDDPYVLRGSCGVEYALVLTALGEQTYPDVARAAARPPDPGAKSTAAAAAAAPFFDDGRGREDLSAWLFVLIFLAVCAWIVYSAWLARTWTPPTSQAVTRSRRTPNTARFDDNTITTNNNDIHRIDDDNDDDDRGERRNARAFRAPWNPGWAPRGPPPPPYSDRRADYVSSKRDRHYDRRPHEPLDHAYSRQRGWTPGFWSGFAGGSAAGYAAGRSSSASARRDEREPDYRAAWEAGPAVPWPSAAPAARSYAARPEPVRSQSHSQSQSGGSGSAATGRSDRYESTGYGSTRRR